MQHTFPKPILACAAVALLGTATLAAANIALAPDVQVQPRTLTAAAAIRQDRIAFAREQGCKDPEGVVDAVGGSPLADLLISVAVEESKCNVNAVGDAGEQGAWQVLERYWGPVAKGNLRAQAMQAEKIISRESKSSDGNLLVAMARYNGGGTPPAESAQYARRILKRQAALSARLQQAKL